MDYIEVKAKTIDDAITDALVQLGITSDQLDYEVIEKGSAGILGLGRKDAVIKARKKVVVPEKKVEPVVEKKVEAPAPKKAQAFVVKEEKTEKAPAKAPVNIDFTSLEKSVKEFLSQVFAAMELEVEIVTKVDEENKVIDVEFKGPEMGMLIGKRGQTLDSLQYLTNLAVNKQSDSYIKVKLDTEDYRKRRKETLENLAKNIAYKVKRTKRPVSLEPMNPFERRVIHSALQNDKYVSTHSEGEEPYRHVVVTLKR
ncbi:MAG: protein jag [bacterium]|nr:protein jag [bacterium]MDY4100019.1 RNA-binding cell elongation regulator Jag/EloR [Lachnospiraceae bacterium]